MSKVVHAVERSLDHLEALRLLRTGKGPFVNEIDQTAPSSCIQHGLPGQEGS